MNHRIGRVIFAFGVGLVVAFYSYQWITNPEPRAERAAEEQVVERSRIELRSLLAENSLEIVDPLSPDRKVGKVYVYAEGPGWAVSGYYRRGEQDAWHPYLMTLTDDLEFVRLKAKDALLLNQAVGDARLEVVP
ncbi:MAG: hypothetical protein WBM76_00420 [Woeseiaceae bacterium]|jgi:hypothetical protein